MDADTRDGQAQGNTDNHTAKLPTGGGERYPGAECGTTERAEQEVTRFQRPRGRPTTTRDNAYGR